MNKYSFVKLFCLGFSLVTFSIARADDPRDFRAVGGHSGGQGKRAAYDSIRASRNTGPTDTEFAAAFKPNESKNQSELYKEILKKFKKGEWVGDTSDVYKFQFNGETYYYHSGSDKIMSNSSTESVDPQVLGLESKGTETEMAAKNSTPLSSPTSVSPSSTDTTAASTELSSTPEVTSPTTPTEVAASHTGNTQATPSTHNYYLPNTSLITDEFSMPGHEDAKGVLTNPIWEAMNQTEAERQAEIAQKKADAKYKQDLATYNVYEFAAAANPYNVNPYSAPGVLKPVPSPLTNYISSLPQVPQRGDGSMLKK